MIPPPQSECFENEHYVTRLPTRPPTEKSVRFSERANLTVIRSDQPVKGVFNHKQSEKKQLKKPPRLIKQCGVMVNFGS